MVKENYVIGIGLNLFDARAILLREDGKTVFEIEKKRTYTSANETIKVLIEICDEILNKTKKYKEAIKGIGLAVGGIVDNSCGKVYWPQKHNSYYIYISLPLREYLKKKIGLPIIIENDANACAWAEFLLNYPQHKNIIYMFSGVGSGIIIEGKLYRGKDGGAGELFLNPKENLTCSLGNFSFLQQWPADLGMVKRAKELISLGKNTSLVKRITSVGELSLSCIFEEAKKHDRIASQVLKESAYSLGIKIAFLVNLLNPEVIIIGGGLEEAGEFFLEECKDAIRDFSFSEMKKNLKVFFSKLGKHATSLGVGFIALKEIEENTLHK